MRCATARVAQLPRATFSWLREREPSFNEFLLLQVNERLHWFMGAAVAHGLLDTDSLVARALMGMVHPLSNPSGAGHLPLSQEGLANLAGVSRQTCNKARCPPAASLVESPSDHLAEDAVF